MIIFVGDKPSPRMKPGAKPFEGAACEARLKEWVKELTFWGRQSGCDWYGPHKIINACDIPSVLELLVAEGEGVKYVALGYNASRIIEIIPHFKLPHPSARNRQINDKAFIDQKLKECKEWLKK